jgi:hypothetical protein
MNKIVLSGIFALWLIYPSGGVQAQNWEPAPTEVLETLEKAAEKQAIGLDQEVSDSLTQLYLNLMQRIDSMQHDALVKARLADSVRMLEVFEKYTRALAKEKRYVPDIRWLAFKRLGLKQSRKMVREERFEIKLMNEYPRVQFTRYRDFSQAQVYVNSKRIGVVEEFKNGLILGSNRDFWVELHTADGLLCAQRVRLKRGEVFDFSCEP